MLTSVIKSKFDLPLTDRIYWKNNSLYKKFTFIDKYPITIIQAPLGYGKTKNLTLFLKNKFPSDSLYWYSLYKRDNSKIDFWHNLVYLFYNEKGKGDILFYDQDKNELDLYEIVHSLLNFLEDMLVDETILVLDNYHLVNSQEIISSLA